MKKLLLSIGSLALIAIVFYACKKDHIETLTFSSDESISMKGDRLAFKSIEAFESFISDSNSSNPNNLVSRIAFKKKTSTDTLIDDEFLLLILNEKNIVEIGGKLYKLDFSQEKVYVLSEVNEANIIFLEAKNVSSEKIKIYSFNDPVLLIENDEYEIEEAANAVAKKKIFCREKGAKGKHSDNRDTNGDWPTQIVQYSGGNLGNSGPFCMRAHAINAYRKYGIYFSLVSRFEYHYDDNYPWGNCSQKGGYRNAKTYIEFDIKAKYQPICRNEVINDIWDVPASFDNEDCQQNRRSVAYSGIRPLKRYSLYSEITYLLGGCEKYNPNSVGVGIAIPNCLVSGYSACYQ